ncbi:MAG: efflux RND transporter permease subunit [Bacteroidales bacterium]
MKRIIKYRWIVIVLSVLVTLVVSFSLKDIAIDSDLKHYFPENMESMVATDQIEKKFGNQDIIMLIFETGDIINPRSLERIKQVDRQLKRVDGIRKTTSLFSSSHIYGIDGAMIVEPAVKRIPVDGEEISELKNSLRGNDLVINLVVAENFRSSAIIVTLNEGANEEEVFLAINEILKEFPGEEKIHFGGLPFLRQAMNKDIKRDALILVPAALLLMIIFLFFVFREVRGVTLPFLVVAMSCILALSLIPLIGWKFYFISLLVPVMLIAVANDYGIHIIAKYQEINAKEHQMGMKEMAIVIARKLWRPILYTGLTTIAGIAALMAHTMIPAREMAVVAVVGIFAALIYSIVLLPVLLSFMKRSKPVPSLQKRYRSDKKDFFNRLAFFIISRHRRIPIAALLITGIIGLGVIFLKVDSNEENFFPEKHPVKQASKIINANYGGSENLSVMFSGDMMDPVLLSRIASYKEKLLQEDQIDLVMTFPDVVKEISKALFDPGDANYDKIPPTRDAVAQYIELYNMNGDPENIDQLVDFNYENAHMIIRINSVSNKDVNRIIATIRDLTAGDTNVAAIGGYGYVRSQLANLVVRGQFYSLAIALLVVFFLLSLIFRSWQAGIVSTIPLTISMILLFGIMGITGVRLDVATALLSSVMIGVGVDYTIHFLWRYREERQQHRPPREAVITTLTTTGRGIMFNAFSVIIGFIVLIISSFTPIRFFGILVVVSIFSCLTGALVLLPALVLKYRFTFLEPKTKKPESQEIDTLLEAI